MKVNFLTEDGAVIVDGIAELGLDMDGVPADVHGGWFDTETGMAELRYTDDRSNLFTTDIDFLTGLLERYDAQRLARVEAANARLDALTYAEFRAMEYPSITELTVARWEEDVEGRSDLTAPIEVRRQEVKTAYPKDADNAALRAAYRERTGSDRFDAVPAPDPVAPALEA
ncbi:MAG: hypothetical protein V3U60_16395 [Gammaproteobacteria bacterium]